MSCSCLAFYQPLHLRHPPSWQHSGCCHEVLRLDRSNTGAVPRYQYRDRSVQVDFRRLTQCRHEFPQSFLPTVSARLSSSTMNWTYHLECQYLPGICNPVHLCSVLSESSRIFRVVHPRKLQHSVDSYPDGVQDFQSFHVVPISLCYCLRLVSERLRCGIPSTKVGWELHTIQFTSMYPKTLPISNV